MRVESWVYKVPLLLRSVFRRKALEHELDEELGFHLEQQIEQNQARGMSQEEARKQATRAFGNIEIRKEECRDTWVVAALDHCKRDTRHALRTLRRDFGFTLGVSLLLALGIGANVAVFSIVNSILFKPLPYREPDRLVVVREMTPERDLTPRSVNALHYLEWRKCECFAEIALAEYAQELNLAGQGDPERVSSLRVTPNAFSMLDVVAQIGRTFVGVEGELGNDNVVVISDGLWRRRFGADPEIVGATISLDAVPYVVIGVLPAGFRYHGASNAHVDIYRPWGPVPAPWWTWTNNYSYTALGRLADGVSVEAALDQLNAIQATIAADQFDVENESLSLRAVFTPLHDLITAPSRAGLHLLLAAVGAALVVACFNIANLTLVRARARTREAGVRAALGASRLAIFRGVLIESLVLAAAGTATGVALAGAALRMFTSIAPTDLPRIDEVQMDWTALLVAAVLAVAVTVAFGLLPALRLTRVDPQAALRASNRSVTDSPHSVRVRQALVSVEVGLSVSLLIVAGLLLTSFLRLDAVDRGFDASNVLTAEVGIPWARYVDDQAALRFWGSLLTELRDAPGVVAAGVTSSLPLRGYNWGSSAVREGENPPAAERPSIQYRFVSPEYFAALGIPLLAGRSFNSDDYGRTTAILSERAARLLWPDSNPIGRRFYRDSPDEVFEVVGLVPDVHSEDLAKDPAPLVYAPLTAAPVVFRVASVVVRTAADPSPAASTVRNAVASLDRELAISNVETMRQIESASVGDRRFQLMLVIAFGVSALLIAALGTYSVLAYAVTTRTHELAMRMALGARRGTVLAMVLRQGMRPVFLGVGFGIFAALAFGRLLAGLLYSVTPTDPTTLISVVVVTLTAAFLASLLPAHRAARTSLLAALRYE